MRRAFLSIFAAIFTLQMTAQQPVDYVSTLVGTQSKFELSTGNTYPAVALPWGMNFWVPQTGKKGAIATSKHGNISHATLTI